jgi:protein-S-isoprenylcysteine O-methyltransferase Ste14
MNAKVWFGLVQGILFFALPLFGAAGTLAWPAAWIYIALVFGAGVVITLILAKRDPALLAERMKPLIQKDQPLWDRIITPLILVLWLCWLALMGLDAVRYGWSAMPVSLQWIGGAGVALSMWIWFLIFRENTFLAPVVKIQKERGHKVISTGPYAVVRHPMYASALILFAASALLLGSWYGLAGAFVLAALLVLRTALEDRELKRGLAGYTDYAAHVRYRLVPLIW